MEWRLSARLQFSRAPAGRRAYASITEMAEAEKLDRGYMGRLLQLTLLAPVIVEAVLDGRGRAPDLPQAIELWPAGWHLQERYLLSLTS